LVLVLMPSPGRVRLLVSLAEDAGVLAILSLLLDAPIAAAALAAFTIGAGVRWGTSASSAFIFALRLVWDAVQGVLNHRRWRGPERFPSWMRRALDDPSIAPAGLRGTPAGAVNLPGLGLFHRGWVVIQGGSPLFVYRWRRKPRAVDLGVSRALNVIPTTLHTRVDLGDLEGRSYALYFSHDGPEPADLKAQFRS
jgi:hypothetical protein